MNQHTSEMAIAAVLLLSTSVLAQTLTFTRVGFRDPMVDNIEGATILAPDGWKVEGGFSWMPLYSMQANLLYRVSDPRSGAAVEVLPAQQFCVLLRDIGIPMQPGANWNGSVYLYPPRDPAQFVQQMYMNGPLGHLRTARLVGGEDLPKLAEQFARSTPGAQNCNVRITRLRYEYDINGAPYEEEVILNVTLAPPSEVQLWWCSAYAMRAPAGKLNSYRPILDATIRSTRYSLDWTAVLEQCKDMFRKGIRQQQQDERRLAEMYRQYREQIREQYRKTWEERDASQQRQNFAFRELLGGVDTLKDPYESRNVELPSGYKDYWVNSKGQYILSMDQTFNPNQGTTEEFKRMDRYQP